MVTINCNRLVAVLAGALVLSAISAALMPSAASAAGRVYWSNISKLSFADLNGNGGDLDTTGATVDGASGVAIDLAAGRIYWGNFNGGKVSFANLDGSGGGGDLNTAGASGGGHADGVAVDPAAGRIYWANEGPEKISFANLNGSGGGDLNTAGATVACPAGVAVDPPAGRIYWANCASASSKISFANLDGSGGGGDLNTAGASAGEKRGVALDVAAGRIYWANFGANKISFANLDGSGGGDLSTTGATMNGPIGVAVDHAAGRIYWANFPGPGNKISFANLDGSGGADLAVTGATLAGPSFPALLEDPGAASVPLIAGGSAPGSVLSCSEGSWAPDLLGSFLYRAPQSFAHQWTLDGADITGGVASSFTAFAAGDYRCRVTASNLLGSASQTSAAHAISQIAFGAKTLVTLRLAAGRIPARGPLKVLIANANSFPVTGRVSGRTTRPVTVSLRRRVALKAKSFSVGANARKTVKLKLSPALQRALRRAGKLSLRLTMRVKDPAGNVRTVTKRISPKLKKQARPRG